MAALNLKIQPAPFTVKSKTIEHLPLLRIHHNHGTIILENVEVIRETRIYDYSNDDFMRRHYGISAEKNCDVAIGTVVGGGSTSRLFHATHTTPEKVGEIKEVDLWGRMIHKCTNLIPHGGLGEGCHTEEIPGEFYVDLCFCG